MGDELRATTITATGPEQNIQDDYTFLQVYYKDL